GMAMSKKILIGFLFLSSIVFGQETNSQASESQRVNLNMVFYDANIFSPAFDVELGYEFWKKGGSSLGFLNSFFVYIPVSPSFTQLSSFLMAYLPQLQYLYRKNGFHMTLETGLGVAADFLTVDTFTVEKGFHRKGVGTTYGLFSAGMRYGYEFGYKYNKPFVLSFSLGYRLQFPFNLTVNHIILVGVGFGYSFGIKPRGV
ncbi:MAG: hypothetical protein ACRCY4_03285, partial [Brevinema sp.]